MNKWNAFVKTFEDVVFITPQYDTFQLFPQSINNSATGVVGAAVVVEKCTLPVCSQV